MREVAVMIVSVQVNIDLYYRLFRDREIIIEVKVGENITLHHLLNSSLSTLSCKAKETGSPGAYSGICPGGGLDFIFSRGAQHPLGPENP